MFDICVIVPTHNRRASLERTLVALARQDYPLDRFEVVVVLDGCTDDTNDLLDTIALPLACRRVVVAPAESRGAAAARNVGAAAACAPLFVFLDDDIEASVGLLGAHADAHHRGVNVSIGYLPPAIGRSNDFFQAALRGWWEAMFAAMRRPGHRYRFRDLLTGNCAIDASLFRQVGGFDEQLRCHEDYELGVRLVEAHAEVRLLAGAAGLHHEKTTLVRAFARKVEEGRADVQMIRKHPHLFPVLPLGVSDMYATRMQRVLRRLLFAQPASGRLLARVLTRSLPTFERARLRGRWRHRLDDLLYYWYWRGVADAIGAFSEFEHLVARCHLAASWQPTELDVDLDSGVERAMRTIDEQRPDGIRVRYRNDDVGRMLPEPGAERLRGEHLRAALARELAGPFLRALGRNGVIAVETLADKLVATGPLPAAALPLS